MYGPGIFDSKSPKRGYRWKCPWIFYLKYLSVACMNSILSDSTNLSRPFLSNNDRMRLNLYVLPFDSYASTFLSKLTDQSWVDTRPTCSGIFVRVGLRLRPKPPFSGHVRVRDSWRLSIKTTLRKAISKLKIRFFAIWSSPTIATNGSGFTENHILFYRWFVYIAPG